MVTVHAVRHYTRIHIFVPGLKRLWKLCPGNLKILLSYYPQYLHMILSEIFITESHVSGKFNL
jgi:hypothetical protein